MSGRPRIAFAPIRADLAHAEAHKRRRRLVLGWTLAGSVALLWLLLILYLWRLVFLDLPRIPPDAELMALNRPPGVTFLDRRGTVIGARGAKTGAPVTLKALPPYLYRAFLAAEDRRFYQHPGVDPVGVARAFRRNLAAKRTVQGGSTITQQIVRGLFLSPDQTAKRKFQEAVLALELERRLPKDRILELYLNRIYFGAGAYGVDAAARTYFNRPATDLDLAQSALLAALPKAPTRLDPSNDLAAAQARARLVLASMRREGWISPEAQAVALAHPAVLSAEPEAEGDFGYVLDLALAEARARAPGHADLVVRLTIDPDLQRLAAAAVRSGVAEAASRGATEGALVALASDGGVAALVGGLDHRDSAFDRATQARRQPGSAFKPFVWAAALEDGARPDDVRADVPVDFKGWKPQNFGGGYSGEVTLAEALARSINTVAARLTVETGADRVAALGRRFGLSTLPARPADPIALGAYEVRLMDLVSAYQVFQNLGVRRPPHLIDLVADGSGKPLWRWVPQALPAYDAPRAGEMTRMMQGVIASGTGRAADIGRPAAGKTGTTQGYRDAWFVGFTPELAAGVWMGDDRNRPMRGVVGGDAPARAWARFMKAALASAPPQDFPRAPGAPDPRDPFYAALADELEQAAGEHDAPEP